MNEVAVAKREAERRPAAERATGRDSRARATSAFRPGEGVRARRGRAWEPPGAPGARASEAIDDALHANLARLTHGIDDAPGRYVLQA